MSAAPALDFSAMGVGLKPWVTFALLKPTPLMKHLKKDTVVIGRSKNCDIIIPLPYISSVHCKVYKGIEQDDGTHQVLIEDKSRVGISIERDGKRIKLRANGEKEALQYGDTVWLSHNPADESQDVSLRVDPVKKPKPAVSAKSSPNRSGLAFGRYRVFKELGSGSFANVKLAFDEDEERLVALKFIDKRHFFSAIHTDRPEARTAEVDLLKAVRHDNIVAFMDEHQSEEHIVLALEYVKGGELFDYIVDNGPMPEDEARSIFNQIVSAVVYLHSKGIAHRDLKPENILLCTKLDGSLMIKITDFGLSRLVPPESFMQSVAGSPGYYAPEVMLGSTVGYTKKVDIWSIGVILYILLSAMPPYNPQLSNAELARRSIKFPRPAFDNVSDLAKDLILKCLQVNPDARLSAVQAANHRWLRPLRSLASGGGTMSAPPRVTHVKRKVTEL